MLHFFRFKESSKIYYYTYILESLKDGRFYIGQTQYLHKRLEHHNKGYSKYTNKFRPWKMLWYKTLESRSEAYKLEQQLKKLKSRHKIIDFINNNERSSAPS